MSKKLSEEEILRKNLVINECVAGLTSTDESLKHICLETILKLFTTEEEFADIKEREKWV